MPDKLAAAQAVFFIALLCSASAIDFAKRIIPNWLSIAGRYISNELRKTIFFDY